MGTMRPKPSGSRAHARRRTPRRWVKTVTTVSTKTPPELFTRDAATIARTLALPKAKRLMRKTIETERIGSRRR